MRGESYISYDAYKAAVDELQSTGVASPIALPFAARQGQVVNICGDEYRLEAPVAPEGESRGVGPVAGDIVGYTVTKL